MGTALSSRSRLRNERAEAVWAGTASLARELGWEYAFVRHTGDGEIFVAQMRQTKHNSVLVAGYNPRVGYSEAFKPENNGKKLRFDAAGALEGTPHWLGISANISDEGNGKALVSAAKRLKVRLERACGARKLHPEEVFL